MYRELQPSHLALTLVATARPCDNMQPVVATPDQPNLILFIFKKLYYIDTSVLLENVPHVKLIKTTSGTPGVCFR